MTETSNRRRSEKLIKPGETLPCYDRAVSRCKQRRDTDSGRNIRLNDKPFPACHKKLVPGASLLPFHEASERMKKGDSKNEQTRPQSCSLGNWEWGIGTGITTSPKLVAVDTRGYETTSQVPTG